MAQVDDNNALKRIIDKFSPGSLPMVDAVLKLAENEPKRDDGEIINQIGFVLCGGTPCSYHRGMGKDILNMVKKHYNIK